ncbi:MAG: transcription elongation factor GreA [Bdellovibrionota bacterium]
MKDTNIPITLRGKQKLEEELKRLLHEERPAIIKAIEAARENGDLSENADYDAAKERQGWTEARILEIQSRIAGAEVIDTAKLKSNTVIFGATVELKDVEEDRDVKYQIVGPEEADIQQGRLSLMAPLARSLIGKKAGDVCEVKAPNSIKEYEIKKIYFL